MLRTVPGLGLVLDLLLSLLGACAPVPERAGIHPDPDQPRYWRYDERTVLLVGGSSEDNLFQNEAVEAELDRLVSAGGNYVRNTMSARDAGNIRPFVRLPNGRYDLQQLDERYFKRFERLLTLAAERNVIVQVELWDRFDFAQDPWASNPYRPANNVNLSRETSGLDDAYPRHPGRNDNPFFRSVPALDSNGVLLSHQQRQVDRLLDISLGFPNVLYTIDNETSAGAEWSAYWAEHIRSRAEARGVSALTTEMWGTRNIEAPQHRRTFDEPERYAFIDISQNNHTAGDTHWERIQWVRAYTASRPRPINNVKIYGADSGRYGTTDEGIARFWRNIVGGAAAVRFHRPPGGLGLSERARAHIRSARLFAQAFDIAGAQPDAKHALLLDRQPAEAYAAFIPSRAYAVYFPGAGEVRLDLSGVSGTFDLGWLDAGSGRIESRGRVAGGRAVRLAPPGNGHWIAVLERP
ncbi:hypothetical protein BH24PSE2_BH24PSE2_00460 [soil metagenome]